MLIHKYNKYLLQITFAGNGWVGWKKSSFPKNFIEIIFEFDEVRNFSVVHLFTNNLFSKDVEVSTYNKLV